MNNLLLLRVSSRSPPPPPYYKLTCSLRYEKMMCVEQRRLLLFFFFHEYYRPFGCKRRAISEFRNCAVNIKNIKKSRQDQARIKLSVKTDLCARTVLHITENGFSRLNSTFVGVVLPLYHPIKKSGPPYHKTRSNTETPFVPIPAVFINIASGKGVSINLDVIHTETKSSPSNGIRVIYASYLRRRYAVLRALLIVGINYSKKLRAEVRRSPRHTLNAIALR